jgi:hypothetical protein
MTLPRDDSRANQDRREILANPLGGVPDRETAAAALRAEVPGVQMDFDEITGGPKQIVATGKFLTAAAEKPAAVVVSDFVDAHRGLFGHDSQFLTAGNARLAREDVSAHNGLITLVWQQELEGIPLFQTVLRANVTKHGELVTLGGSFLSNPAEASGKDLKARAALVAEPPVTAKQAVALAAANARLPQGALGIAAD